MEDFTRFHRGYFLNDCKRRFHELDVDSSGLLGLEHLQDALVDMFPTLKLELRTDGHHIPALDKSIPSLIAAFDGDSDGYLDFDDFVQFIKFQQAWRAQFFLSERPGTRSEVPAQIRQLAWQPNLENVTALRADNSAQVGSFQGLRKSASLPKLGTSHKPVGKRAVNRAAKKSLATATFDGIQSKSSCTSRPSSTSSCSTRCSSSQSSRSGLGGLDSSRGAFYSSLMGFS